MKIVERKALEIFEVRKLQIFVILSGLLLFLSGCFIISPSLGIFDFEFEQSPAVISLGGIFLLGGLIIMTARTVVTMDRRAKTIVKWHGLLVPMLKSRFQMDDFDRVTIKRIICRDRHNNIVTINYPVTLESSRGAHELMINFPTVYNDSRVMAEKLAKFLGVPMADSSSGTEVVREHDNLNESIRDKAQRAGEELELPDPPPDMKAQVNERDGAVLVDIPPPGLNAQHKWELILLPIISMLIGAFIFFKIFLEGSPENPSFLLMGIYALGFLCLTVIVVFFVIYPKAMKKVHVKASRDALIVEESVLGRKKVTTIPGNELEDLYLGDYVIIMDMNRAATQGSNGNFQTDKKFMPDLWSGSKPILSPEITARSDRTSIQFGRGLSSEELAYIYAIVKKAMIGE